MVHTDAHSSMVLLTDIDKGHELCLYLLEFGGILLVGIFQVLKRTARVYIVAGIDAYLLAVLCSHISGMGRKVHVGY